MALPKLGLIVHNKHFKRNKNSWLGSASLHILTNYFCPLKWALGEQIVMSKVFIIAAFLLLTLSSNAEATKLIVIEINQDSIRVDGITTANLLDKLNSMSSCERVHLIVDKNLEPEKVVNTMDIVKSANCANISTQSV
jgi:hypothetical protein